MSGRSNVIDFVAYKAKRETEEYLEWARYWSMASGRVDFDDPDFWDDVREIMEEEHGE